MAFNGHTIIDGDGHVIEDTKAIVEFMPPAYREKYDTHSFFNPFPPPIIYIHRICTIFNPARSIRSAPMVGSNSWKMSVSNPPSFTPLSDLLLVKS